MKLCRGCGEQLDLSAFYKDARMADGHLNHCKACVRKRVKKHRVENDSVREYDRKRNKLPHRRELAKEMNRRHHSDPLKHGARLAVVRALRNDQLAPASACECQDCRKPAEHLHHHSYAEEHWLDVVPLCARCHTKRHADGLVAS